MSANVAAAGPTYARIPLGLPVAVVVVLLLAKLGYAVFVPPNEDEAYYWQWGQHPALSYFDHAPLAGWTQGLASLLFGWSIFALRAMTFVTLAGTALIFWSWSRRLAPTDTPKLFWTSFAVYLASPLVFAITTLAYPDHWLMFLSLASAHFFALFLGARLAGEPGRYRDLYLGAALLGLAALAKYNAVVMGLAVAGFILFHPRLRPLLRDINLWAAALLSVAMLAPVLAWNASNGFVSFAFQLYGRYAPGGPGVMGDFSVERFGIFVLTSIIYFGPFLMPALLAFLWRPAGEGFRGAAAGMGKWAFVLSSLAIGAIAFYARAAPHWNILAILIFLPMAALYVRWRWVLIAHLVLGAIAGAVLSGYLIQYPFLSLPGDREGAALYGYDQVAERMEALRAEHGAASLAAISYGATSKLAFGAGPDVPVTSLSPVRDAYDEWRDDAALAGKDMIIHDEFGAIGMVAGQFEEMVKLEDFTVTRFGRPTIRYEFYLGRGYKGAPGT